MKRVADFFAGITRSRWLRHGLNAAILTVAVLGVLVMGNVLAGDYRLRIDVTRDSSHSLSELTTEVLRSIDQPVKITAFMQEGQILTARVRDLLEEYGHNSRFITVQFIDPERDPSQAKAYGVENTDTTVFECEGRVRHVPLRDVYYMDQNIGLIEFTGEQAFTQALLSVLRDYQPVIRFTEGHGERSPFETLGRFRHGLIAEGFRVEAHNLGREGSIPEETELLVIAGPERDFDRVEADALIEYLADGGRLLVFIDPSPEGGDLPELRRALSYLGVSLDDSLVVDVGRSYFMDPYTPVPYLEYHKITDSLIRGNLAVILPYVRSMRPLEDYDGDLVPQRLMWTSDQSWGETDLGGQVDRDDNDLQPPLTVGMVIDREVPSGRPDGGVELEPLAAIIGSCTFATDGVVEFQGNLDLVLNMANYLAGHEEKISIRPKDPQFNRVFMSGSQARTMFYSSVFALPGAVLLVGTAVWLLRRTM